MSADDDLELMRMRARARARAAEAGSGAAAPAATPGMFEKAGLPSWLDTFNDSITGVGDSIPGKDELFGGIDAVKRHFVDGQDWGPAYDAGLAAQRGMSKEAAVRSPAAHGTGEILGGTATLMGAAPEALGASVLSGGGVAGGGKLLPTATEIAAAKARALGIEAPSNATLAFLTRMMKGGGIGAGYGAAIGFGEGEGVQDRLAKAGGGALWGGLAGAGSVPIVEGAVKLGQSVLAPGYRAVTNAADQATRNLAAKFKTDRALEAEASPSNFIPNRGMTDAEFEAAKAAGAPVLNVDRAGPTVLKTLDAATVRSPVAAGIAEGKLNERHSNQFPRYEEKINSLMPEASSVEARDRIINEGRKVNDINYKLADLHPNASVMWDDGFKQLMQSDVMQPAMRHALASANNDIAVNGGTRMKSFWKLDNKTGQIVVDEGGAAPNLRFWDKTKQGLDDVINNGTDPITKKMTNAAREAQRVKDKLVAKLDAAVPLYAKAREGAGRYFGLQNASELGQELYAKGPKMGFAELKKQFARWTPAERKEASLAYLDAAKTNLKLKAKEPDAGGKAKDLSAHLFGGNSRAHYDTARLLLGDNKFGDLASFNAREALMAKPRALIEGNSKTAQREKADILLSPWALGGAGYIAQGEIGHDWNPTHPGAVGGVLAGFGRRGHNVMRDRMAEQFARLLMSTERSAIPALSSKLAENPRIMGMLRMLETPTTVGFGQSGGR